MDQHTNRDPAGLFAPPDQHWQRLSPRYRALRRLTSGLVVGLISAVAVAVVVPTTGLLWPGAVLPAVGVAVLTVRWLVVGRNWRSWGYAERPEDLYLTRGVLFRRLTAVPYGRMQVVEVTSGPLQRAFGLATVSLQTASPRSGAQIPGLPPDEAVRLRDRLIELGQTQAAAL